MENKKSPEGVEEMVKAIELTNDSKYCCLENAYKIIKEEIEFELKEDKVEFKDIRFLRHELMDNGNGWSTVKSYFEVIN